MFGTSSRITQHCKTLKHYPDTLLSNFTIIHFAITHAYGRRGRCLWHCSDSSEALLRLYWGSVGECTSDGTFSSLSPLDGTTIRRQIIVYQHIFALHISLHADRSRPRFTPSLRSTLSIMIGGLLANKIDKWLSKHTGCRFSLKIELHRPSFPALNLLTNFTNNTCSYSQPAGIPEHTHRRSRRRSVARSLISAHR